MCNDPIYKHELKCVQIVQSNYYKEGQTIKFNLMVRSKGNIIVKDKSVEEQSSGEESKIGVPTKLYTSHFPTQGEISYKQCRLLLSDSDTQRRELNQELVDLLAD